MARKPMVRWFESKQAYYVQIDGQRHRLGDGPDDAPMGPNFARAVARYGELIGNPGLATSASKGADDTIRACAARYREWLAQTGKVRGAKQYDDTLKKGLKGIGDLRLSTLKLHHVEGWLNGQTTWGGTMRFHGWRCLVSALKWNVQRGHTALNPLAGVKAPNEFRGEVRGSDSALSDDLLAVLIANAAGPFGDYLTVLLHTGARPGELDHAEAKDYRQATGTLFFSGKAKPPNYRWKNAGKTGKDRVIYLTPEAKEVVERRIAKQGAGPVFLTKYKGSFASKNSGSGHHFWRLKKKPKVVAYFAKAGIADTSHVTLYSFRHTYATRALKAGVPVKTLADLMGTSVAMIERHYAHLTSDQPYMRRMADLVRFST